MTMSLNLLGERIVQCNNCDKEFLFWGTPNEGDELFCSPECTEQSQNKARK